eukprot:1176598-Prorocentrum_minimum.AAC.3
MSVAFELLRVYRTGYEPICTERPGCKHTTDHTYGGHPGKRKRGEDSEVTYRRSRLATASWFMSAYISRRWPR